MCISLDYLGINKCKKIYRNLPISTLVELSIERKEGQLCENGSLVVETGKYTGRSPEDRFIVKDSITKDSINWGKVNKPIKEEVFNNLYKQVIDYLKEEELFVFDGFVGAMEKYRLDVRIICEYANQALFSNQLFIRPYKEELKNFKPEFTVIVAPGFKAKGKEDGINSEAFVLIDFSKKMILIGGTKYAGEIKKAVFTVMNFILPKKGVFPMHASANIGSTGDSAIFFGLSGTGKTTLSTDPYRKLIGDDEHGWCDEGIFNFEGGCYAKTINLSREHEKEIYDAIKFGTLLENVVLDENKNPNYDDGRLTENSRAAYPIDYIDNVELSGIAKVPNTIIFLTADAFGVMPPISKLTKQQAMYHFMSGYTSKIAGTERGITEPKATFSACFGEPFMPMNPSMYAQLLGEKIDKYGTNVFLVNTGWLSGGYGKGDRIKLVYTRAMIRAALNGILNKTSYVEHPIFKVLMPTECEGVPSHILNPENTWNDKEAYRKRALELGEKFIENFTKFKNVPEEILKAEPKIK